MSISVNNSQKKYWIRFGMYCYFYAVLDIITKLKIQFGNIYPKGCWNEKILHMQKTKRFKRKPGYKPEGSCWTDRHSFAELQQIRKWFKGNPAELYHRPCIAIRCFRRLPFGPFCEQKRVFYINGSYFG